MTIGATTIDFLQLWTQSDQTSERKLQRLLLAGLDEVRMQDSGLFPKLKKGPVIAGPIVRWMEEKGYPTVVTAALSTATLTIPDTYKPFGENVTADTFAQVIRTGTVLRRVSDNMQIKVTTAEGALPTSTPWAVTVAAHGGSNLGNDVGDVAYEIISEAWSDYTDSIHYRAVDRTFRNVGCQIYAENFEIAKTRKNTKYEIVADEVEHQIKALIEKLYQQRARAMIVQKPAYANSVPVYGDTVETSYNCGLCHWPTVVQAEQANTNVYVNAAGAPLGKSDIDTLVYNHMVDENANYNTGNWALIVHPFTHQSIQDWDKMYVRTTRDETTVGGSVKAIETKSGITLPIISDRYMRQDVALVADLSQCSWGDFAQDSMDRKEVPTQGRYERWLISFQSYGMVVRKPRQSLAMIYGLPVS